MPTYKAPLRDLRFVYYELFDAESLTALPGMEDAGEDLVMTAMEELARICEEVIQPLNAPGDEEGCRFEQGKVISPKGFKEAYDLLAQGGWTSLICHPDYGGQGLPHHVDIMAGEMLCSSNLSFAMYQTLTSGAYLAIDHHASQELKDYYLPKLTSGEWAGTMCLTEPQAGSDLGLVRMKAEPREDGSYLLTGTKIFISAGEHDMTENIVHLVLARLPDAPAGTRGISLFIVPKRREEGGKLVPNGVTCGAIEHKMGIKASATCVMNFDGAVGHLVGEPHKGMRAMFTFMNAARLHVGIHGLALAEAACQGAVQFARERLQGRSLTGAKYPELEADPILVHPDVRRMLLACRAFTEGARALTAWTTLGIIDAEHHPDPERRQAGDDLASLLTPVVKAFQTDLGFETTNTALQVCGGYGFTRDYGMEQFVRDCRITQIYEGTNGIQGLDLVGRKMPANFGRSLRRFFHPVSEFIAAEAGNERMKEFVEPLAKAFERLQRATGWLAEQSVKSRDEAGGAATDYLHLFGWVAFAYLWARMAKVAMEKEGQEDALFYQAKIATARFFVQRMLPRHSAHFAALLAGAASMMEFPDDAF